MVLYQNLAICFQTGTRWTASAPISTVQIWDLTYIILEIVKGPKFRYFGALEALYALLTVMWELVILCFSNIILMMYNLDWSHELYAEPICIFQFI